MLLTTAIPKNPPTHPHVWQQKRKHKIPNDGTRQSPAEQRTQCVRPVCMRMCVSALMHCSAAQRFGRAHACVHLRARMIYGRALACSCLARTRAAECARVRACVHAVAKYATAGWCAIQRAPETHDMIYMCRSQKRWRRPCATACVCVLLLLPMCNRQHRSNHCISDVCVRVRASYTHDERHPARELT